MITKKQFVLKVDSMLKKSMPSSAAQSAINEMRVEKLGSMGDSNALPEKLIDETLIVLFSRISFIKGDLVAEDFVTEFNNWRYG